jgi:hypothetical protein
MKTLSLIVAVTALYCSATHASGRNLRTCLSADNPVSCVERGYPRHVIAVCEKSAVTTAPTGRKLFDLNELINCFAMSESSGGE